MRFPDKMNRKLTIYILICLVLLLGFQIIYHLHSKPVTQNARLFIDISANLLDHRGYSFDGENPTRCIQPLYTYFVLIFYQLTGQNPTCVIIAQIILNLIGFLLVLRSAYYIFEGKLPIFLPALLACHVAIWFFGMYILNEGLFIFLSICQTFFLIKAFKFQKIRDFIFSGVFMGLAFMTRPIGLGYIIILILPFIFFGKTLRKPLMSFLSVFLPIIIVSLPWTIRNYAVMGKLTPLSSEDRYHLYYASLPDSITTNNNYLIFDPVGTQPDKVADSVSLLGQARDNILKDPMGFLWRGIKKNLIVWINFPGTREWPSSIKKLLGLVFQIGMLIFAAIGLSRTEKKYALILILPVLSVGLVLFFTYATTRFAVPTLPFVLILTAKGMESSWSYLGRKWRRAGNDICDSQQARL